MRIIKEAFLVKISIDFPQADSFLTTWRNVVRAAKWKNLIEVRKTYPTADGVKVDSGRVVTVFKAVRFATLPRTYKELCGALLPRPIHDKHELEEVTDLAEAMEGHEALPGRTVCKP
ncbi:MAG TPA: hypothetical protein VEH27_08640 [Methylomirabilota bacterium]|nr:hypothetical protein [Methylomirabilota bacterium]